jgi:hypothetical protein
MTILSADLKVLKQWGYNGISATTFFFILRWLTYLLFIIKLTRSYGNRRPSEKPLRGGELRQRLL